MSEPTRRDFLKYSAGAAFGMRLGAARAFAPITNTTASNASLPASTTLAVKKGLVINMLPVKMSYADRFKLARDAGFEVVQALTTPDERVAEELKIVIAIEEVWNKFLLSPLEMATYISEFKSPWVRAWFDVGNVVLYGYPQDWIRTLGSQIYKVHLKDFKRGKNSYSWANLGDGDIDWRAVRAAFLDVGYNGSVIAELEAGDETYLKDVSRRIDKLLITGS